MAEAFLRKYGDDRFVAYSAGLEPKDINPYTLRVMEEVGLSLDGQYSKSLTEYMGKVRFGYMITVCADAEDKCPSVFPGMGQRMHWGFEDPAAFVGSEEETLAKFRDVRDEIDTRVREWLEESNIAE
jgi:arsenate reductase